MKKIFLAMTVIAAVATQAGAVEKDRGGESIPYAEGSSSVMLNRSYSESLVEIKGRAAQLLFKALKVDAEKNADPFARRGQDVVKQKGNVKCLTSVAEPRAYNCLIRVQN